MRGEYRQHAWREPEKIFHPGPAIYSKQDGTPLYFHVL
jgi:hypothetical protein